MTNPTPANPALANPAPASTISGKTASAKTAPTATPMATQGPSRAKRAANPMEAPASTEIAASLARARNSAAGAGAESAAEDLPHLPRPTATQVAVEAQVLSPGELATGAAQALKDLETGLNRARQTAPPPAESPKRGTSTRASTRASAPASAAGQEAPSARASERADRLTDDGAKDPGKDTGAGTGARDGIGEQIRRFRKTESVLETKMFDRLFETWEKRTSEYCETLFQNPHFLDMVGAVMNQNFRRKIMVNKAFGLLWKGLNLPNKRDQERTLHLLNELHSRIFDLEKQLKDLKNKNANPAQATGTDAAGTARR